MAKQVTFRALAIAVTTALVVQGSACNYLCFDRPCEVEECGQHAKVCTTPTVRALAQDLDQLEHQIERRGSVVTSQPSVWGQARPHSRAAKNMNNKWLPNWPISVQPCKVRFGEVIRPTSQKPLPFKRQSLVNLEGEARRV